MNCVDNVLGIELKGLNQAHHELFGSSSEIEHNKKNIECLITAFKNMRSGMKPEKYTKMGYIIVSIIQDEKARINKVVEHFQEIAKMEKIKE